MAKRLLKKRLESLVLVALPTILLIFSTQVFAQEKAEPQKENEDNTIGTAEGTISQLTDKTAAENTPRATKTAATSEKPTTVPSSQAEANDVITKNQTFLDECLSFPKSRNMNALNDKKMACETVLKNIEDEKRKTGNETTEIKLSTEAAKKELEKIQESLPDTPINSDQSWSLTVPLFTSLIRVQLGNSEDGTADQFLPFTGVGSGLKFRYSRLNRKGEPMEIFGASLFTYFEPAVKTNNPDQTAQTLSLGFLFTTVQYFGLGIGYKIVSNEPAYDRSDSSNVMILLGIGVDGNTLTP